MALKRQSVDPPVPPLPDLICGSKRPSNVPWNVFAAAAALALALKVFGPSWLGMAFHPAGLGAAGEISALFLATAISIVWHEGGHLAAALLLDFEVLGGSLGPVRAIRTHNGWSLQFSRRLFTGSVIAIPRCSNSTWRKRMLCVIAAGPAATFFAVIASAGLLLGFGEPGSWLTGLLSALVELNFFLFVLGLFPNASAARSQNDARLFCSLFEEAPEAEEILVYHLLTQMQMAGVRPRDYQERIIRQLALGRRKPEMCLVQANAIVLWAVDRNDLATADAWDKRAIDISDFCDLKLQNSTLAASACWDILFRDDLRSAKAKFADVEFEILSPDWFQHRAKAAYHLACGRILQALAEIARARYSFPNRLPYYDFERMLLGELHRRAVSSEPQRLVSRCTNHAI